MVMELAAARLILKPFREEQISDAYLAWLNDPEVNRYSRRRFLKTTRQDAEKFIRGLSQEEEVLGIYLKESDRHIGNIQWGPINEFEGRAEIRILMGDRSEWGKGYASEAIEAISEHLFIEKELRRLEANTCNPAFARCMEKLGWRHEGSLRKRFPYEGKYLDYLQFGLLREEWENK